MTTTYILLEDLKTLYRSSYWALVSPGIDSMSFGLLRFKNGEGVWILLLREISRDSTKGLDLDQGFLREDQAKIWMKLTPEGTTEGDTLIVDTSALCLLSDFLSWLKWKVSEELELFVQ